MTAPVEVAPGLVLAAEGALAVPSASAVALADPHVGYETVLGGRGLSLPAVESGDLAETLAALRRKFAPSCVVVAGDLKHGSTPRQRGALERFVAACAPASVVVTEGNHDAGLARLVPGLRTVGCVTLPLPDGGSVVVAHGHEPVVRPPGAWLAVGHEHPAVRIRLGPGGAILAPCFLVDPASRTIVLPAASPWAAGGEPGSAFSGAALRGLAPRRFRAYALVDGEVFDVGPLRRGAAGQVAKPRTTSTSSIVSGRSTPYSE